MRPHRPAGVAGRVVGALAGGTAVGIVAERYAVGRVRLRPDPLAGEPVGELAGRWREVTVDDGAALAVLQCPPDGRPPARVGGPATVVFVHGYALDSRCWYFQWRALAAGGGPALVCYDQRGHGRSAGGGCRSGTTLERLADDLAAVLDVAAPAGPVVLVGHSMGAMTVAALLGRHPELVGQRVSAVALLGSAPGRLAETTLGLPAAVGRLTRVAVLPAVAALGRRAELVDLGRRWTADLAYLATARLAFGGPVPPSVVALADRMLADTRFEVIAGLYPALHALDQRAVLPRLAGAATLVVCGGADRITPPARGRELADAIPGAQLEVIDGAGHLLMLERPARVTAALRGLLERAAVAAR